MKRFVYAIRIFTMDYQPMAELAFGDGGKPTGETVIIHWNDVSEREKYCINSYTLVWDERTKRKSFDEYIVEKIVTTKGSTLKPCPFCGNWVSLEKKPLWRTTSDGSTHGYYNSFEYVIQCDNPDCGCKVNLIANDTIYRSDEEAKQNAIKAWNRRASDE